MRGDANWARSGLTKRDEIALNGQLSAHVGIAVKHSILPRCGCLVFRCEVNKIPSLAAVGRGGGLARIFHQNAELWRVVGEPDQARTPRPIDHSIGRAGMPDMAGHGAPETA